MKTKVFVSRPNEGWSEIRIPKEFEDFSYEIIVSRVHAMLRWKSYKGLLITENPSPFPVKKRNHVPKLS